MTPLQDALHRVFGPLAPNTHPYYSEVAGTTWWTGVRETPEGCRFLLAITHREPDDDDDDDQIESFLVDVWWLHPRMKGSMVGLDMLHFDPRWLGSYTTEDHAVRVLQVVEEVLIPKMEAEAREAP